jgi:hypothetical protein
MKVKLNFEASFYKRLKKNFVAERLKGLRFVGRNYSAKSPICQQIFGYRVKES